MLEFMRLVGLSAAVGLGVGLVGCGEQENGDGAPSPAAATGGDDHGHDHADGDHDHDHDHGADDDHMHGDEVSLGMTEVGGMMVECWQGHGAAAAGKELHLVVKLTASDNGASTVRVWIGTEDRFASVVEKADYAADHDDYDVHALAPDPLPADAKWWIEIETPDGERAVGSIDLQR